MKILQVGLGNNPGGMEAFVMNYYRELAKRGISFDFVSMYGKIAYESEILSLSGRVFYVPNVKKDPFGYVREMRVLLAREHYDVVHVHMLSAANILPLKLAKEAGVRMVIAHSHNTDAPGILRKAMDAANRPKISRYAVKRLACSEAAGRWLFGNAAFSGSEVKLVANAIDVSGYLYRPAAGEKIRREFGIPADAFVAGHVGRFQIQKNHELLIDIFAAIAAENPKAMLLLAGDGELAGHIRQKVSAKGLEERVIFAGVRDDVGDLLSAMDVFVLPSLFEGLPFTLVEAQANGLPCVVSDTITDEAVVSPARVCRLSTGRPAKDWAAKILSFAGTPREDSKIVENRLREAHFDIHEEAGRLLEIYGGTDGSGD